MMPAAIFAVLLFLSSGDGSGVDHLHQYRLAAYRNLTDWRSSVFAKWRANPRPAGYQRYEALCDPVVACPPHLPLAQAGHGDEGKWLCGAAQLQAPCLIYSLGSNNLYGFEEAMLATTPCELHTFDCTVQGKQLHPQRHHFHTTCIGKQAPGQVGNFSTLTEVMAELGHKKVEILKVDIEGYEFQLFEDWHEDDASLPQQVAVELHFNAEGGVVFSPVTQASEMALYFLHMANLGYAAYSRERNVGSSCCYEYSFIRVQEPRLHPHSAQTTPGRRMGVSHSHSRTREHDARGRGRPAGTSV